MGITIDLIDAGSLGTVALPQRLSFSTCIFSRIAKQGKPKPSVIEDAAKGAEWIAKALSSSGYRADFSLDNLREVEINLTLVLPNGTRLYPVQRVLKRFQNGAEDGLFAYASVLTAPT